MPGEGSSGSGWGSQHLPVSAHTETLAFCAAVTTGIYQQHWTFTSRKLRGASAWRRWCCWNHLLATSPPFTPLSHLLDTGVLRALLSIPSSHKVQLCFLLFFETFQLSYWAVGTQPTFSFLLLSSIPLPSTCSGFQYAFIVSLLIAAYMFKLLFPSRCITWRYWIPTLPFPPLFQSSDSGLTKAPVLL